jgi:kynureninase
VNTPASREAALALDAADPLAHHRERFVLPDGVVYLDGNSLGPPTVDTEDHVGRVVRAQWGSDLIRSWTDHGWIDLPDRVARSIAPLIGAAPDEVAVTDTTSINIFKLLAGALRLRPGRRVILTEDSNFPTDLYMAQGLVDLLDGRAELRTVERDRLEAELGPDVAVLMLTHVDFKTGEMHHMAAWTAAAHAAGALVLFDLSHTAGAVPVDLGACGVDLAVGCGYKYLNGGPGAPAFAYVARGHHDSLTSPLWGWMGHAEAFEFDVDYRPAAGVQRLLVGTPPILSLAALEEGIRSVADIGIDSLRAKSIDLTGMFMSLVDRECTGRGFEIVTPRDPALRGSQVSLRHPEGYAVMQALIANGVVGDFRSPDILRFGFAPAYVRFVDVWDAVAILRRIMDGREWDRDEYRVRRRVT